MHPRLLNPCSSSFHSFPDSSPTCKQKICKRAWAGSWINVLLLYILMLFPHQKSSNWDSLFRNTSRSWELFFFSAWIWSFAGRMVTIVDVRWCNSFVNSKSVVSGFWYIYWHICFIDCNSFCGREIVISFELTWPSFPEILSPELVSSLTFSYL